MRKYSEYIKRGVAPIALPAENDAWLTAFARGFFRIADQHRIELVGGDTTRGTLTISITVMGEVPPGQALRPSP